MKFWKQIKPTLYNRDVIMIGNKPINDNTHIIDSPLKNQALNKVTTSSWANYNTIHSRMSATPTIIETLQEEEQTLKQNSRNDLETSNTLEEKVDIIQTMPTTIKSEKRKMIITKESTLNYRSINIDEIDNEHSNSA